MSFLSSVAPCCAVALLFGRWFRTERFISEIIYDGMVVCLMGSPPDTHPVVEDGAAIGNSSIHSPGPTEPASGSPAQSVGFTLSSLGYAVSRRFHATLAPLGLEPREFALLRTVAPAEGASQQALAERLQIPPSRMVAFVDTLEARGLLERRANPDDRRARALYLTDKGRKLLATAFALASELETQLCAGLSASERERLLSDLQSVGAQLGIEPGAHSAHSD